MERLEGFEPSHPVPETEAEITVLKKYLPSEMSEEAIRKVVTDVIAELEPGQKTMGSVMKAVMAKLKGQADGKAINRIVREVLSGS